MKQHVWKVVQFSGWFVSLVAVIFALLYATLNIGAELYGAIVLMVAGVIMVLVGEYLIVEQEASKLFMLWQAISIGGAFSLTVGIIWMAIQFMSIYQSWISIVILLALGIGLIIVGESIKVERPK